MRPSIKYDGFSYVDDLLCMIHQLDKTMDGIKGYLNLKDDKVSEPYFYLGASIYQMQDPEGQE